MTDKEITSLLYTIYTAGFTHGVNEGAYLEHGTLEAFNRLLSGKSPLEDGVSYDIKDKVELLYANNEAISSLIKLSSNGQDTGTPL